MPDTLNIKYNSYDIAGLTKSHIYLSNPTAPLHLLVTNTALTDTQHIRLNIKNIEKLKFRHIDIKVDSPYFYMMDGTMPGIFRGVVNDWVADRFMFDSAYFIKALPISTASFALRTTSSSTNEQLLGKESNYEPHVKLVPGLLEKQIDGIFCTDGMFHYNKELGQLVYLYFYRNQYIVIDTSMNLVYRGNTIDTTSRARIKTADISSENARTLSAPPQLVNTQSCVSGNWLFVNSNLMAKNEVQEVFEKNSVIDVYNLKKGTYEFSFYIYPYNGIKMKSFKVMDDQLIAIHDHYLLRYKMNLNAFEKDNL